MDRRVLLVEDNPLDQNLATTVLRKCGYSVDYVGDGLEAIGRVAAGNEYDLILIDYELPTINGFETTERLRSLGYWKPIIAVSAGSEAELIGPWREAGCSDFLGKPYLPRQLREIVKQALLRRPNRRPSKTAYELALQST
ncbi:response regulator [Blastopirellula retiformator]|uniref:response regulator n=1 Tax=Blastopirellula retiformator TaxID=2527970 RepID=UPI0011B76236|nr:response regulator [Blastopirellula retiformator]